MSPVATEVTDATEPAQVVEAAAALGARWADKVLPGGPKARNWEAYRAGGIQAMTDIASALAPP